MNGIACNSEQKWNCDECQCECKELDDWGSCRNDCIWNSSMCGCECKKACQVDRCLNNKNGSCEKRLFLKLALAFEFKILSTTGTSLNDENVTCKENNCFIHKISFSTVSLLLSIFISIRYYYYTKQRHLLPFSNSSNKFKELVLI